MAARELASEAPLELPGTAVAELRTAWWLPFIEAALPWVVCLGLALAAYGSSLRAGIMFDAALDLPRATERSWIEVLKNAGASPYYRPITLLLWKASFELLGHNDFLILHAISLASHAICGWLVYQLARRLMGFWPGLVAAALFVWFPLSYQVVGFVDSTFHSLAAMFVLATAVLYWDARALPSRWRLAGALVAGGLALLTHETTAVLLAPALVGLEILLVRQAGRRENPALERTENLEEVAGNKWSWLPACFLLETLAFAGLWLSVPRWPSSLHLDLPSIKLNAAYFLQAMGYPLTAQLGSWPRLGNDVLEVLLASGLVLVALLALVSIQGRLAVSWFGLAWFALALLPAWLFLPWPNYVIDAPRLLYVASAGLVLIWAAAIANWGSAGDWRRRVLSIAATVAVLWVSWSFVASRERLLDRGARVVGDVMTTAAQPGPEAGRIYINVPAFVGPKDTDFLLGHSGVTMLPDYFGLDLDAAAATGRRLALTSLAYDDLAQPWDVAYGFQGQRASLDQVAAAVNQGGGVYVSRFDPGQFRLDYMGGVNRIAAGAQSPVARFGDWVALDSASAQLRPGSLAVRLQWRTFRPAPGDDTVFVHVIGAGPQPLIQSDGYPLGGLLPPRLWQADSTIDDLRAISIPTTRDLPTKVLVGFYDRAAPTKRAAATNGLGSRWLDDAVEIPITRASSS